MTREEAIHELQEDKTLYETEVCHAGDGSPDGRLLEALDMAIEALSADAVSREEYEEVKAYMDTLVDAFIEDGEELAESVKVVRCKDCRHCSEYYDKDGYPYWICDEWDSGTGADGFCYHGERKEE